MTFSFSSISSLLLKVCGRPGRIKSIASKILYPSLIGTTLAYILLTGPVLAQENTETDPIFHRIGTGSIGGTYLPIGETLARIISNPTDTRDCESGGSCGVPNLIATALSTKGSIDNINLLKSGDVNSAFAQADIAFRAFNGSKNFDIETPFEELRLIANLFPETLQIVLAPDLPVFTLHDLQGMRISLGEKGSGTRLYAKLILETLGVDLDTIDIVDVSSEQAAEMIIEGELDGFFLIAGIPTVTISELALQKNIKLLGLSKGDRETLEQAFPFFTSIQIPATTYQSIPATDTLSVGALWITRADQDKTLIYEMLTSLWHETSRETLDLGHPNGKQIQLNQAAIDLGIPFHDGAEQFYREQEVWGGVEEEDDENYTEQKDDSESESTDH